MGTSGTPRTALLKLSGEALAGESGYGIDTQAVRTIAAQVVAASQAGVRTALVMERLVDQNGRYYLLRRLNPEEVRALRQSARRYVKNAQRHKNRSFPVLP